jgi:hypothetical protein
MYSKIKNDLEEGIERIKWFAQLLSDRVRIEMDVFRLTYRAEELKKKRNVLLISIGEEVCLMGKSEKGIHANRKIMDALEEINDLEPRIRETNDRVTEITRIS